MVEGLSYVEEFVGAPEEDALLRAFSEMALRPVVMHGQESRRTVTMFGLDYDYEGRELVPAPPWPDALGWLRERAAELIGREPQDLAQVLVSRYPPGAGIGWHRDAPMFGSSIVGVSLLGASRMRFQRRAAGSREVDAIELAPRSAYVLSGAARWSWQHSIPATKEERWSVTFRTLRRS
jgi:alkylated DNA repair protein (DNA oxidative demethylase)